RQGVLVAQRTGDGGEVVRQLARDPLRQQEPAQEDEEEDRPGEERDADQPELEEAEPPPTRVCGGLADDDVHRCPGEQEHRAGMCGEGEGQQQVGDPDPGPGRDDDDHRDEGGHRTVDGDDRGDGGDEEADGDEDGGAGRPGAADHLAAGPGGHAGGLECLADHEQRGDEQHGGIADPARAWSRSSTPLAHRASETPTATTASGTRPETKARTAATRMLSVPAIAPVPYASTTTGMIIGRRLSRLDAHRPTTRRMTCCSWCVSAVPPRAALVSSSATLGRMASKTDSSSAMPRAWMWGPATTAPVAESTAAKMEMKPSSPRMRRSLSSASVISPTLEPST